MKSRKSLKITQRVSSVTNSFVQAVIPWVAPTADEQAKALDVLGMSFAEIECVYCGVVASDWDHLRPLVRGKRPTGFISDYKNLVPSCGRCNQSKGAHEWRSWIDGRAKGSPASRKIADIEMRKANLEAFEIWGDVSALRLEELASPELWVAHWNNLEKLERGMFEAQRHAEVLRAEIAKNLAENMLHICVTHSREAAL
jgi:hypothetical protein